MLEMVAIIILNGQLFSKPRKKNNHRPNSQDSSNLSFTAPAEPSSNRGKPTVVIASDSILKYSNGRKISHNDRIQVKTFPKETVEVMADYVKPTFRQKPEEIWYFTSWKATKFATKFFAIASFKTMQDLIFQAVRLISLTMNNFLCCWDDLSNILVPFIRGKIRRVLHKTRLK